MEQLSFTKYLEEVALKGARDTWDSNMPGYKGGPAKRTREDDEGYGNKNANDRFKNAKPRPHLSKAPISLVHKKPSVAESSLAEGEKTYEQKHTKWVVNHGDGHVSEFKAHEDDLAQKKFDAVKQHNNGAWMAPMDQRNQSIRAGTLKAMRNKSGVSEEVAKSKPASPFDLKNYKTQIDWTGKEKPKTSASGGTVYAARDTERNAESGGAKDKQNVGRPKGDYGSYKIDKGTRDDPDYKKKLSDKVMAAKKDGFAVRGDYKTAMNDAIKKRQAELWAKNNHK